MWVKGDLLVSFFVALHKISGRIFLERKTFINSCRVLVAISAYSSKSDDHIYLGCGRG